jgi:hypothetical protein
MWKCLSSNFFGENRDAVQDKKKITFGPSTFKIWSDHALYNILSRNWTLLHEHFVPISNLPLQISVKLKTIVGWLNKGW